MGDLLSALLVMGLLIGIIAFSLKGMRPTSGRGRYGAKSFRDLGRYRSADAGLGWVAPLIGLIALLSLTPKGGEAVSWSTAAGLLGAFGAAFATWGRTVRDAFLSVVGVVASASVVVQYIGNDSARCDTFSLGVRVWLIVLTIMAFAIGFLIGLRKFVLSISTVGIGLFSVLEALVWIASPFGLELTGGGLVVTMLVAVGFGLLTGAFPMIGLTLAAPAFSIAAFGFTGAVGTACTIGQQGAAASALIVFLVLYGIVAAIRSRITDA